MILAGDIGGTHTRLALYSREIGRERPLRQQTFTNGDYLGLEDIVAHFLNQPNINVDAACFGVAGPVSDGRVALTNLPWVIEEESLSRILGIQRIQLINDLEATASAIPTMGNQFLDTLNVGKAASHGAIALIAPGTGLGEAFLIWDGTQYQPHASEGGHADFAPTNALESGLLTHMQKQYPHVSFERLCSGMGIPNIYNFFIATGRFEEPSWLAKKLSTAKDPSPIIFNAALDPSIPSPLCKAVVDTFISILGSEAGNLALKMLSKGGLYLCGGIPPKIRPAMRSGRFMHAFVNKGRLSNIMSEIPVHIILHPQAALLGAACRGLAM